MNRDRLCLIATHGGACLPAGRLSFWFAIFKAVDVFITDETKGAGKFFIDHRNQPVKAIFSTLVYSQTAGI